MADSPPDKQEPDIPDARAPGRASKVVPIHIVKFLELLRRNGNVSMSARLIGWSRSTVYAFAGKNPSFREAMKESLTEDRELLVGEGWRRAYQWSEFTDTKGTIHVKEPSDRLLSQLIGGYFPEFKPGRGDDVPADALLPETADPTLLEDHELEDLERLLVKAGADDVGPRAD